MIRYLSSFVITSILYSIFIGLFLFAYANQKVMEPKIVEKRKVSLKHIVLVKKEKEIEVVENKIVEPIQEVIKEEIVIEKPKKKEIKKIVKKPIVKPKKKIKKVVKKKKIKKPIKKVVKKKLIKKKELPPKIVEKEPTPIINTPVITAPIVKQKRVNVAPIVNYKQDFLKKNLQLIKKQIQKHVKYSKRARKMSIQGNVIVQFELLKNGTIKNIKAISGHKMLRRSTIKAIEKAASLFPRVHKNITIKVPINYKLI